MAIEEIECKILDAIFEDNIGTEENPIYENHVVLELMDVETEKIIKMSINEETINKLVGHPLSSKQMIEFAEALRSRDGNIMVEIDDSKIILDNKED